MIVDEMRERLRTLNPIELEITDESALHAGHAGWREGGQTHFRVRIGGPVFNDLSRIARHRLVHNRLGEIVGRIHALSIEFV